VKRRPVGFLDRINTDSSDFINPSVGVNRAEADYTILAKE